MRDKTEEVCTPLTRPIHLHVYTAAARDRTEVDVPQEAETIVRFRREMKRRRDDLFEER